MSKGLQLLVDGHHGVYVPEVFANNTDFHIGWKGITEDDIILLKLGQGIDKEYNADCPIYWEIWDDVLSNATYTDKDGHEWFLYQDGDLWAVCAELLTDEEYLNFFGENREIC